MILDSFYVGSYLHKKITTSLKLSEICLLLQKYHSIYFSVHCIVIALEVPNFKTVNGQDLFTYTTS